MTPAEKLIYRVWSEEGRMAPTARRCGVTMQRVHEIIMKGIAEDA